MWLELVVAYTRPVNAERDLRSGCTLELVSAVGPLVLWLSDAAASDEAVRVVVGRKGTRVRVPVPRTWLHERCSSDAPNALIVHAGDLINATSSHKCTAINGTIGTSETGRACVRLHELFDAHGVVSESLAYTNTNDEGITGVLTASHARFVDEHGTAQDVVVRASDDASVARAREYDALVRSRVFDVVQARLRAAPYPPLPNLSKTFVATASRRGCLGCYMLADAIGPDANPSHAKTNSWLGPLIEMQLEERGVERECYETCTSTPGLSAARFAPYVAQAVSEYVAGVRMAYAADGFRSGRTRVEHENWREPNDNGWHSLDDCDGGAKLAVAIVQSIADATDADVEALPHLRAARNAIAHYVCALCVLSAHAAEATQAIDEALASDAPRRVQGHANAVLLRKSCLLGALDRGARRPRPEFWDARPSDVAVDAAVVHAALSAPRPEGLVRMSAEALAFARTERTDIGPDHVVPRAVLHDAVRCARFDALYPPSLLGRMLDTDRRAMRHLDEHSDAPCALGIETTTPARAHLVAHDGADARAVREARLEHDRQVRRFGVKSVLSTVQTMFGTSGDELAPGLAHAFYDDLIEATLGTRGAHGALHHDPKCVALGASLAQLRFAPRADGPLRTTGVSVECAHRGEFDAVLKYELSPCEHALLACAHASGRRHQMPPQPVNDATLDPSEERAYHASVAQLRQLQVELAAVPDAPSDAHTRFLMRADLLWNNPKVVACLCEHVRALGATGSVRLYRIEGALRTQAGAELPVALVALWLRMPPSERDA
jgi:hypothetical protein